MLFINSRLQIPLTELGFSFARSGGPGGQNVNKVNSKAILRWSVTTSSSLPTEIKTRFISKYANRLTTDGELILTSQKYRDQTRNVDDCLDKLQKMIISVASPPKLRRPTKPTQSSKQKRKQTKLVTSKKKEQRRAPRIDD